MQKIRLLIITGILLAAAPVYANQALSVSQGETKLNVAPYFAVNSTTGDALVVWTQFRDSKPAYGQVHYALLKRDVSGRYWVAVRARLSKKKGFNARPFPLYLPHKDHFLVVWDQADPTKPLGKSDIQGRLISTDGAIKGGVFTVSTNGARITSPQIYLRYYAGIGDRLDTPKPQVLIAANIYQVKLEDLDETGLHWGPLNDNNRAEQLNLIWPGGIWHSGSTVIAQGIIPDGPGRVINDTVLLTVLAQQAKSATQILSTPHLVTINRENQLAHSISLGPLGSTDPRIDTVILPNVNDALMIGGIVNPNHQIQNTSARIPLLGDIPYIGNLFKKKGRTEARQNLIVFLTPRIIDDKKIGLAAKPIIGWEITAAQDNYVYRRKIRSNGRIVGGYKKVFNHGGKLMTMNGQSVIFSGDTSNKRDILIVWQKQHNDLKHEIRAFILQVKK